MPLALGAIVFGLILLVWSADRFIVGASQTAKHAGLSPLIIGMVIVGFGTSAPEMIVSAIAASEGSPGLALGNALGSNIVNISLILGVTALISPIAVKSSIIKKELPLLLLVVLGLGFLISDNSLSSLDAWMLLACFAAFIIWTISSGLRSPNDPFGGEVADELDSSEENPSLAKSIAWLVIGLALLLISSRLLVWGAVEVAQQFGVSDLLIGLTIVALGTSLPELAASIIAARKGVHEIAIGNVVGSNIFNILAVIGIAGVIEPIPSIAPEVFLRDWSVMLLLTVALLVMGYGFGREGRINRYEGGVLLVCYLAYNGYLVAGSV